MFFTKLRRLFHHKKSSKAKKVSNINQFEEELINRSEPPKFATDDENAMQGQTPPKHTNHRIFPSMDDYASKNTNGNIENEFALTTKQLPRFRTSAKWQSSRPFAQNALRYRFYCRSKGQRIILSSRSKNASSSNQNYRASKKPPQLKHIDSMELLSNNQQISMAP